MKFLLLVLLFFFTNSFAQNGSATISGFVFDESSSEAIIGVNVFLEKEQIGASTNNSGYYVITDVPQGELKLVASFLGYKTEKRSINVLSGDKKIKVNIFLKPEILETETIVVSADSIPIADQLFNKDISHIFLQ